MKRITAVFALFAISAALFSCAVPSGTVTETNGTTSVGTAEPFVPSAEICKYMWNAKGAVTVVFDDGIEDTATWVKENYPTFPVAYSIIGDRIARLKTAKSKEYKYTDERGRTHSNTEYVLDENGKFVYTLKKDKVAFWQDILDTTDAELLSHTFTHMYTGTSDDGGYVEGRDDPLPGRCVTADVIGAGQVLREVFGGHNGLIIADAGVGVSRHEDDHPLYYNTIYDYYIGCRGGDSEVPTTYDNFEEMRYDLPGLMPETATEPKDGMTLEETRAAQLEKWLAYIDSAIENESLTGICVHCVGEGYIITSYSDMAAMLDHCIEKASDGSLWIAKLTDATMYMEERLATAVNVTADDGCSEITVTLVNDLDPVYDEPLTVKIAVPGDWNNAVLHDGTPVEVVKDEGHSFVIANILPNSGSYTIKRSDS